MNTADIKRQKRIRRKHKIRNKVSGSKSRPRLSVFRSNTSIYVQLIDDNKGKTLVSAHSREIKAKKGEKKESENMSPGMIIGHELGKLIAKKALSKKIDTVVFDRGGYKYHGRVKAVAEGARAGGLNF
jgi:large subunit ribosomal protein L18